jgi:hypothetical protein
MALVASGASLGSFKRCSIVLRPSEIVGTALDSLVRTCWRPARCLSKAQRIPVILAKPHKPGNWPLHSIYNDRANEYDICDEWGKV